MVLRSVFAAVLVIAAGCSSAAKEQVDAAAGGDAVRIDAGGADAAPDAASGDGCTADAECASGACHEATGVCVPEDQVLFVAVTGADGATCTRTAPCATIARATALLSAERDTIAVAPGTYAGTFGVAVPALLSGPSRDPSQVFLTSPAHDAIIVRLETAAIELETVSIGGNTATNAPQAVTIGGGATITLDRVIVRDNAGTAVFSNGSMLRVRRYEVFASQYGILADSASTIDVDGAYVHDNHQGLAAAGGYSIVNTILAHNPIDFIPFNGNTGTLAFDTFIGAPDTLISTTHAIPVTDSIFMQNAGPIPTLVAFSYSLFSVAAPPGAGNLMGDPQFVDAAHGDYHLGPTSAALDRADPGATLATDFEGDARPNGAGRDIGADER